MRELTTDERAEYSEINAAWRHDDTMTSALAAVTYPITVGAFVAAVSYPQARYLLALGSLALYLVFFATQARLHVYTETRLARARELEEIAGLNHHRAILATLPGRRWYEGGVSIRRIRGALLLVLIGAWTLLLVLEGVGAIRAAH